MNETLISALWIMLYWNSDLCHCSISQNARGCIQQSPAPDAPRDCRPLLQIRLNDERFVSSFWMHIALRLTTMLDDASSNLSFVYNRCLFFYRCNSAQNKEDQRRLISIGLTIILSSLSVTMMNIITTFLCTMIHFAFAVICSMIHCITNGRYQDDAGFVKT